MMIHQASFKGLLLPRGEKSLKVQLGDVEYQVQVFEDWTVSSKTSTWRARLVGAGRLNVAGKNAEAAKVATEGLFRERTSEWRQI
jgi:hypothetical protein